MNRQRRHWTGSAWVDVPGGNVTGNNLVWRKFTFAPISTDRIRVLVNGGPSGNSRLAEVEAWTADSSLENFAWQSNGGVATASSVSGSGYEAAAANNGDRRGVVVGLGGFWRDGTSGVYPDWLQIDFNGAKSITEIDVFTVQDTPAAPVEPTPTTTFTLYGISAFQVQYWNGSAWVDVPGGSVTGNKLVWRQFTFSPIVTDKIRVLVTAAAGNSRITEVEAWGSVAQLYYIHPDHLNTPRVITNYASQEVWRWDNADPFGNNAPNENPSSLGSFICNLRFPGQYFDKETGLHYNYQRDAYDAGIGRYTQPEPIGLVGDINLYRYARNNPLTYIDPDGRSPTTAVGGFVGSLVLPGPGTVIGAGIGTAIGVGIGWWAMQSSSASDPSSNTGSSSSSTSQQICPSPCVPPEGTKCWVKGTGRPHAGYAEHWDVYEMQRRRSDNVCFWAYRGGKIGVGVLVTPPPADMSPCSAYPNFTPRPPHAPR